MRFTRNHFAILLIKKLRTKEGIFKLSNHNDRRKNLPINIDPDWFGWGFTFSEFFSYI